MKFETDEFKDKVVPLINEAVEKGIEIACQLCKDKDKIFLGKKFYGCPSGVSYDLKEMEACEKGEWEGNLHIETLPHLPAFPSDVDIKNDFDMIRKKIYKKPFEECVCAGILEGTPKSGTLKEGCFCERWKPWTEEQHKEIIEKIEKSGYGSLIPRGWGYFPLRQDLIKMGHIDHQQKQWVEGKVKDGKIIGMGNIYHEEK